jgi:tetratricopeptide (TPR) repeat protein
MAKKQNQAQKQPAPHRLPPTTKKHWLNEGNMLCRAKQYDEALDAFGRAIQLDLDYAPAYRGRGDALLGLMRYEKALAAYERVIQLEAGDTNQARHSRVAQNLKRFDDTKLFSKMGYVLYELKHYEEALAAYERAIQLDPDEEGYHHRKGMALYSL